MVNLFICRSLAVSLLAIILAGCAFTEKKSDNSVFESIDENHDGKIVRGELAKDMTKRAFDKVDVDDDDTITLSEWELIEGASEEEKTDLFQSMDRNRNRRITFLEFSNYADNNANIDEAFIGLDRNRDGGIVSDEISTRPHLRLFNIRF